MEIIGIYFADLDENKKEGMQNHINSRLELGIYDMSGNVAEWTADCWNFDKTPKDGTAWRGDNCFEWKSEQMARGGDYQSGCRIAGRYSYLANYSSGNNLGFRLVCD